MATSNRIRALNRLPFDFQDGLKVGGVDVTALNQTFTPAGAGLVGFTPVGNLSAGNVQAALAELESEKVGFARLDDTDGSSLVGYDGGTVQDVMDSAKPMADYAALRAYTGRATSVRITSNGISGFFYYDSIDTTSADNGGTVIVSANGKRWKRVYSGSVHIGWFGATGLGVIDETDYLTKAAATKKNSTTVVHLTTGTYKQTAQISLTGYNLITGEGDATQLKVTQGTSLAYTSQTGVFDDHPHNTIKNFRITGDGVFSLYPNAQTGTTNGLTFATVNGIGNNATAEDMTFELHSVGRYIRNSYGHSGARNHYRGNKIGLKLEESTSFTESNSYFRHNSTAGVQIIGGQNIVISGGAIEGNAGIGLQYIPGLSGWGQLTLHNVYFESNGNSATGLPSIDVPFNAKTMVNIYGGNYWTNSLNGIISGHYALGDNALIDGATINGKIYVKYARVRNTRGFPSWNTSALEAEARMIGLTEPTIMLEYSPSYTEYTEHSYAYGPCFCSQPQGRGTGKIPGIINALTLTYPYGFVASSGATGSANATLNYGEGDFLKVQFAASVGNFSSNYVQLGTFTDITKPYRVLCFLVYPEQDCEIGIVQSGGGQSASAFFQLKANTYYRLILLTNVTMSATSYTRFFPINSIAPAINFYGLWQSQHTTHKEQILVASKLVDGDL